MTLVKRGVIYSNAFIPSLRNKKEKNSPIIYFNKINRIKIYSYLANNNDVFNRMIIFILNDRTKVLLFESIEGKKGINKLIEIIKKNVGSVEIIISNIDDNKWKKILKTEDFVTFA